MKNLLILLFFTPFLLLSQNTPKAKKAYAKAVEFYQESNDKKARQFVQSAIQQDANYLPSYLLLGQLEEEGGNIELAIDNYLKGISDNNPINAWGYWKVGMLYMQIPNYLEAKRAFNHFQYEHTLPGSVHVGNSVEDIPDVLWTGGRLGL